MYYEIHGDGFPLVMIIGASADINWWGSWLYDILSKEFKIIIFDNRGAGKTDKPDIPYTTKMMADDIIGLLNVLKIKRAHILGISLGGMIAQELAINYPYIVNKLVLCSTSAGGTNYIPPSKEIFNLLTSNEELSAEEVVERTIPLLFTEEYVKSNPDLINKSKTSIGKNPMPRFAYKRQVGAAFSHNAGRRLKKLNIPTLIMHGKKDLLVPTKNAELLAGLIPNAKLELFENTAHSLFTEETDKVLATLLDFLKN